MGRFLRGCPPDEVRTSAVSPGAVVLDAPLRMRAAMAHPNPLRPTADAVDIEPSIQNDAAMETVLIKGDRIFPQQQQQQQYYFFCRLYSYTVRDGRVRNNRTVRAHDTESEQQQTGQNT